MKFIIESIEAPVVEIDSANRAVYIRFRKTKVARTVSPDTSGAIVAVDLDRSDNVVGVELIGVREFSLPVLLRKLPFLQVKAPIEKARYVATRAARMEQEPQMA